jgi:hypothetical protein
MHSEKKKKTQEVATVQVGVVEAEEGRPKRLKGRTYHYQFRPVVMQTT